MLDVKSTGQQPERDYSDLTALQIQVIDCLKPGEDEIILPKTSADVFSSTNIDYVLRCLGVKYLLLAGCVTDQCVESAVRHACDLGYLVTLVTGNPPKY